MDQKANPAPGFKSNPDKKISVHPHKKEVVIKYEGNVVATTSRALALQEDGYPVVLYVPFEDIKFERLSKTSTRTHCPYKGDASYWQYGVPGETGRDIMWSYETPFDESSAIKDYAAFFPDRVAIAER